MSEAERSIEIKEEAPPAPLWHFISISLVFLIIACVRPGGKGLFAFAHLNVSASRLFSTVIILNVLLVLYAIWGFHLTGNELRLIKDEDRSWQTRSGDILIGTSLGIGLMIISVVLEMIFPGGGRNIAPALAKTGLNHFIELVMILVASICEEIQFRGYFLQQLLAITHSAGIAVVLQAVLFVFMHGSDQGASGYVTRFTIGIAFGVIAILRNSLWPSVLAHLLINITVFFLEMS